MSAQRLQVCPGCGAEGLATLRVHAVHCPTLPRPSGRFVNSLGESERDTFWRPADKAWPVYWWRTDVEAWVCAPTITAGIQAKAHLTDGRVCRKAGFVELVLDENGRPP